MNYYNENDPKSAAWLRELIKANLIVPGVVDERSIVDVKGEDLKEFVQCHFFAGIGGWSYALRLAGWPDNEPVWTGSCPCQPFSGAGKGKVDADERHLWPAFRARIAERGPAIVFGEQVASKDGRIWLAGVRADLEALGYGVGAADLCAAGVSAPMVSQRLHWVAAANVAGCEKLHVSKVAGKSGSHSGAVDENSGLAKNDSGGQPRTCLAKLRREESSDDCGKSTPVNGMGSSLCPKNKRKHSGGLHSEPAGNGENDSSGMAAANGYHSHWWSGPLQVEWNCMEGEIERGGRKYRAQWRVKPGVSLLADGVPGRVAQLCGFGNAIVPQLAAEFIQASIEALNL